MTENKRIIYIDVATEDIHTFYLLDKKYKLVRQIVDQLEKKKV